MSALLSIRGLIKRYGGLTVTDRLDLDVEHGHTHAIIGPNGAGKTTLLGQIAGEVKPDAGTIAFGGVAIGRWPVARRARLGIGRSYQINSIVESFSVLENLVLAVQAAHGHNFRFWRPATDIPALVDEADTTAEQVGIAGLRDRIAGQLAYGEQRQLELAMALATRPQLLLLDEPMAGLGPSESERMVALIERLRRARTIVLVEHDMQAVFALADRVSVLVQGQVVFTGSPADARQSSVVRDAYLGDEELSA